MNSLQFACCVLLAACSGTMAHRGGRHSKICRTQRSVKLAICEFQPPVTIQANTIHNMDNMMMIEGSGEDQSVEEGSGQSPIVPEPKAEPESKPSIVPEPEAQPGSMPSTTLLPMLEEIELKFNDDRPTPAKRGSKTVFCVHEAQNWILPRYPDNKTCSLNMDGLPAEALKAPFNERTPHYVDKALLIVRMAQCSPLSVYYEQGVSRSRQCTELHYQGDYPLKCMDKHFRHGMVLDQRVLKISCGPCNNKIIYNL